MKTPSRTLTYVALAAVAVVMVVAFGMASAQPNQPNPPQTKFILTIGRTADDYADLSDKNKFDQKLKDLKSHGGQYHIRFKATPTSTPIEPYEPLAIKTDKVTTSEIAQSASSGSAVANDPNVTNHLYSNNAADISAVLGTFQ
jgi:hypothetical protein